MSRFTSLTLVPLVFALSGQAFAQTPRPAVEGSVLVGGDARDNRLPTIVLGGGLGALMPVSPRFSLGLDVEVPDTRAYNTTNRETHTDGTATVWSSRRSFQGTIVAGILSVRLVKMDWVNVSFVTGFGIERRAFGASIVKDTVDASGVIIAHEVIDTSGAAGVYHWPQVPLGIDAAIALGRHLSLVPEFRFYFDPLAFLNDGCCDGAQTRVRVGVRWQF